MASITAGLAKQAEAFNLYDPNLDDPDSPPLTCADGDFMNNGSMGYFAKVDDRLDDPGGRLIGNIIPQPFGPPFEGDTNYDVLAESSRSTLVLKVDSAGDCLVIELPRQLIDSQGEHGEDIPYTVLSNGEEVFFTEWINPDNKRVLEIELPGEGEKTVEIVGTRVAPEFGSTAMIIAAIAMMALVGYAKLGRNQLGIRL